jgi:tRNA(fMet)-specific endonuclease VapC
MKKYLMDTNLLFVSLRAGNDWNSRQKELNLGESQNFISVVTVGELWSLSLQNNWGAKRIEGLEKLLLQFTVIDINIKSVVRKYAEIDAYSQGKLVGKPLSNSARNMGKNDLWIAATASALDLTLLTTDADFEHLNGVFLEMYRM